ncbi:GGDEF domain-containing protein, partial [Candidatus Bipolaricaulota bacterium]|nr:GGDEF domain-containing protein [Candidatus Bipolaricaulota bacterium]
DVDADEASAGALTIFINHRVVDDDENLLGVTGVGLSMSGISELLAAYKTRYGRLIYMIDSDGLVQAHPDMSLVESMSIADTEGIRSVATAILAQRGEASFEFDRAGQHVLAEARFFPKFEWYLIAEQEAGASMGRIRSALFSNLVIGLLATVMVILIVVFAVNRYQGQLEALVSIDPLTGVANRRHFMETLQIEFARSRRYKHGLSLLMIDVDRFKRVNDQHGHLAGDRLLAMLTKNIQSELWDSDTLGRVGGEEFGVVLPMTALSEAILLAE